MQNLLSPISDVISLSQAKDPCQNSHLRGISARNGNNRCNAPQNLPLFFLTRPEKEITVYAKRRSPSITLYWTTSASGIMELHWALFSLSLQLSPGPELGVQPNNSVDCRHSQPSLFHCGKIVFPWLVFSSVGGNNVMPNYDYEIWDREWLPWLQRMKTECRSTSQPQTREGHTIRAYWHLRSNARNYFLNWCNCDAECRLPEQLTLNKWLPGWWSSCNLHPRCWSWCLRSNILGGFL